MYSGVLEFSILRSIFKEIWIHIYSPGAKSQKRPRNGFLMTPSIHKV